MPTRSTRRSAARWCTSRARNTSTTRTGRPASRTPRASRSAILRYNRIPARVLVEVCNLNNPDDRRLLRTRKYRERVADALVAAVVDFYGGSEKPTGKTAAGTKR